MKKYIDQNFRPDAFCTHLDRVHFAGLYRRGYRLILLDLDNTLAEHGASEADEYAKNAVKLITEQGFACWIITNAARKRGEAYAASIPVPVAAMAGKPSSRAVRKVCAETMIRPEKTVLIGDQLFTDVWCAKRAGCHAILVQPRSSHEAWNVKLKRWLEKPLYRKFRISSVRWRNGFRSGRMALGRAEGAGSSGSWARIHAGVSVMDSPRRRVGEPPPIRFPARRTTTWPGASPHPPPDAGRRTPGPRDGPGRRA